MHIGRSFPLERIDVWNRDAAAADLLAANLRKWGVASMSVGQWSLEAVASQVDIVSTATLSSEPIVKGEWLSQGSHLDLIGSFTPQMREADDAAFKGAKLFVDTEEALQKSGDLLGPMSRGVFSVSGVAATMADLCTGVHPGRSSDGERTVFKSVGTALEDLAAAILAYEHWCAEHT